MPREPPSTFAREVPPEDADELRALVEEHLQRTGSRRAAAMLAGWDEAVGRFRQIVPVAPPPPAVSEASKDSPEEATRNGEKVSGVA